MTERFSRRRTTAVTTLAALLVGLSATAAQAGSAQEPASIGAYFYDAGIDKPEAAPAPPPNVTGTATDGVEAEHLAVAVRAPNRIDKLSFLFFDLANVPADGAITKAVLTVPLADPSQTNVRMSATPAKVRACPADDTGFNGEDGQNIMSAPNALCKEFSVTAKASADEKAYVFDISKLAASWLTAANNGVALTVAEGAASSAFQVVFQPAAKASLAVDFTEPPTEPEIAVVDPGSAGTDLSSTGDTGSFDTGSFDSGGSEVPVTDDVGGFGVVDSPSLDGEVPGGPEPEIAGEGEQPVAGAATGPRRTLPVGSLRPTTSAVLGAVLLVGLLALLSLVLGDSRVPLKVAGNPSRLTQALQSRQRGTASATSFGPGVRP